MSGKNCLCTLLACAYIAVSSSHSHAEESDPLVFTLTRRTIPMSETTGSITTIPGSQIEKEQKRTVMEALKDVPAVDTLQTGGPGGLSAVFIRGANPQHTLVLLDGVPLTDPMVDEGSYDFAHLFSDNIDRIEVSRGPQSVLYGSSALGGIVHLFTKRGNGPAQASLSVEGGSQKTTLGRATASGGNSQSDFLIGVSALDTAGISQASSRLGNNENDPYQNRSGLVRVGFHPTPTSDISFLIHATDAKSALDNFGGAGGDDPNYRAKAKELVADQKSKFSFFDGRWEPTVNISYTGHKRTFTNDIDVDHPQDSSISEFNGRSKRIDWQNDLYLHKRIALTLGAEYRDEQGDSTSEFQSAFGPFTSNFAERAARTRSIYGENTLKFLPGWSTSLGGRIDEHDQFGSQGTYRVGSSYLVDKSGTRFSGSYGTGFKSPTLFQLYSSFGDPALRPEESVGWDAGFNQSLFEGRISFGSTYFRNDFNNLIEYNSGALKYKNIASALSDGVESFASVQTWRSSTLRLSHTAMNTRDNRTGEELIRRARYKASLSLNTPLTKRSDAIVSVIYVGPRKDLDFSTFPAATATLDAYTLTNIGASVRVGGSLEFFGRIENLFNEAYEEVKGFGTLGRSAFVGAKISL